MYVMQAFPSHQQALAGGIFSTLFRLGSAVALGISTAVFSSVKGTRAGMADPMLPYTRAFQVSIALRAALGVMRRQRGGHVVVVTGLTAAMGTAGLTARCAADHAIEGLLEALAYEVAPFGVRVSLVQPSVEAAVFGGGEVQIAPEMQEYAALEGGRQLREMRRLAEMGRAREVDAEVLADTVRIVAEIAGAENPPGRITVGEEGAEMVRERLKTLSEEMEEFLEASLGVDIAPPAAAGPRPGDE